MQINGFKFLQDKGWKPASVFTTDNGQTLNVKSRQSLVCLDESGDIVNLVLQTESPLTFKPNELLKPVILSAGISKNAFGWTVKGHF